MIGDRIKEYRMNLRYKGIEFSKILGISSGSLSEIENLKTKPSADTLEAMVRKTDVNPNWLFTGKGSMRKGDYRTGDGQPFFSFDEIEQKPIDQDLVWKVVNAIQFALAYVGLEPEDITYDKRENIQKLLYDDALERNCDPRDDYARVLCNLAVCEHLREEKQKKSWKEKWGVGGKPGQDLDEISMLVTAQPGQKCPMEGAPRKYITDNKPVTVFCTAYYRKLVEDGSLIIVKGDSPKIKN